MNASEVVSVADARAGLSSILKRYRRGNKSAVILGSHRKPEAVIVPYTQYISTTQKPSGGIHLDDLRSVATVISALASAHDLHEVAIFGSVARGTATSDSDVDLLVRTGANASLFDIAQFEIEMEELMKRPVHVLTRGGLELPRDSAILAEAVSL